MEDHEMPGSVILSGARTPIGKLGGALASVAPVELGALAIAEALRRGGVPPEAVGYVVMGHVLQAGQGQNPARQAAVRAGVPMGVPALTVNKVCLSGLNALHLADLMIGAGEADVVVAGGMESMSKAPYLLDGGRSGLGYGDAALRDDIVADGLSCAFEPLSMGAATDRDAAAAGISRAEQDAVAARSHDRAAAATKAGRLSEEIVPVNVPRRRGDPVLVFEDEGIRPGTTEEQLAGLRSAFSEGGAITAGNASQISDGAAAVVVASRGAAARFGVSPMAEIVSYGQVAGPGPSLLTQPSRAIAAALQRGGLAVSDLDAIEVNEAFAAVVVASARDLSVPDDRLNPNGGAIALGHPLGMSGARLALTLSYELHRRGGVGAAALCGGGGQGDAVVLRSVGA
jgi:acetyl-CoA C-acetyltransferase